MFLGGFESSKEQYEVKKHLKVQRAFKSSKESLKNSKNFQEGCILQQESGCWMTMMRLNKATTLE